MFDIGFTELTLLAVVGLLVLGPERLPAVARVVGGYLRKARRTWSSVRAEIEAELSADEIRRAVKEPLDELNELRKSAQQRIGMDPQPSASAKERAGASKPGEPESDGPAS